MTKVVELAARQARPLPANEAAEQALWVSPTMRLIRAVETVFDVTADQMRGRNRSDRYTTARSAVAWCGLQMGIGPVQIARVVNKDPSTVSKIVKKCPDKLQVDPFFARCCDEVLRRARDGVP